MSDKKHKSFVKDDTIYEMVYNKENKHTQFAHLDRTDEVSYLDKVETLSKEIILPFPAESNFVKSGMVLFPTKAEEYGTEEKLLAEIRSYINKYLEVSEFMQEVAPYYVLLTWIYDNFHELPYLRVLGDYGMGKSRFLKVVGSICYKPMFTIGAISDASVFRFIDEIQGTLIIDEADIKYSNSENTLIQILNSGYQKGFPIYRCLDGKGNFDVVPFRLFGPKILAGRHPFDDTALESRCLVEKMGRMTRKDIPTNLTDNFEREATTIRNKLLLWRFRNYGKRQHKDITSDLAIEPRLKQIIYPLAAIIEDKNTIEKLQTFIKNYNQELINDRGLSSESKILEVIIVLLRDNSEISISQIIKAYNDERDGENKITAKKLGSVIRKQLGFKTYRKNIGYMLNVEHAKLELPSLCIKFGIDSEQVNSVNDLQSELNDMGIEY